MKMDAVKQPAKGTKRRTTHVEPISYETLLSRLTDKDRGTLERQIASYDAKAGHKPARRWRQLACLLMTLAPLPGKITSGHTMRFYIPDGKYRKQVYALQGMPDGTIVVYAPDVVEQAIGARHLRAVTGVPNRYRLPAFPQTLEIDALDGKTPNPDPVFKDMTGWNRKAIRMTLSPTATDEQLAAVEHLCTLAAEEWAGE